MNRNHDICMDIRRAEIPCVGAGEKAAELLRSGEAENHEVQEISRREELVHD